MSLRRRGLLLAVCASATLLASTAAAMADVSFVPDGVSVVAHNQDGTIDARAGSHPASLVVHFRLVTNEGGHTEGGRLRNVLVDLPPGLIGNPTSVPACPRADFERSVPECPTNTQVGVLTAIGPGLGEAKGPVYNMVPPPGVAAQLAFGVVELDSLASASLLTEEGYGVRVAALNAPVEISAVTETVWGVPAASYNDSKRGQQAAEEGGGPGVSSTAPLNAFLTLPTSCQRPAKTTVEVDTLEDPGHYVAESTETSNAAGEPQPLTSCGSVPFSPSVHATPTSSDAEGASGIAFQLDLPNGGLTDPEAIAETEPVRTEVTLPEGVTANPAAASGLTGCSEAQYRAASLTNAGCPESSKLGTLVAHTPLLEEAIEGSVYLATPHQNRFGSLLALYIVARAPERGVLVKQAGEVKIAPSTGRLTTIFDQLPPLPYSSFELRLREGERAPLITPETCGVYQATAKLYPFSDPSTATVREAPFTITAGAGGAGCVASEAQEPNAPSFQAGTLAPVAGAYSPFSMQMTRAQGSQHISAIDVALPPGLVGKIAGIPECPEAAITQAQARSREGEGAIEQANPSCPAASQVGTATVGVGAGSPLYVQGRVYLAGPYEGAPFSLAIVTPALAGPFDLGTVVVRAALHIDPHTAQVAVTSDPLPTMLDGIPLDIRSVAVQADRGEFTFNPTNCEPMSVGGSEASTAGQTAALSNRFQVGGCRGLAFKPSFTVSTSGKTSRKNGASLHVKLAFPNAPFGTQANVRSVHVELPRALPSRLSTLNHACPAATFEQNPAACSAASRVGSAKAITPVLPVPLEGPAYFVSHGGQKFPELIVVLQGDGVTIDLAGETFINEKTSITSSTFKTVPDVPVSDFELTLPQGEYSALGANTNLCAASLAMPTVFTGQNGALLEQSTPIEVQDCPYALGVLGHRVKKRTLTLKVSVPAAGKLVATGKGVTRASKTAKARQALTLRLKQRHAGRLHTTITLRYTPNNGRQRKILRRNITVTFK